MIVLDTSFLVGFAGARDVHHPAAVRLMGEIAQAEWGMALVPEYVFSETMTVLAARAGLPHAVEFGELLAGAENFEVVACHPYFQETRRRFRDQAGRRNPLSFTDAAVVVIAQAHDAEHVATFDHGFDTVRDLRRVPA